MVQVQEAVKLLLGNKAGIIKIEVGGSNRHNYTNGQSYFNI